MNYQTMTNMIKELDYIHVGTVEDVEYYTPNDEDLGPIVAVDHANKLVKVTDFYEMGDIYPGSDYAMVSHGGELVCRFEQ